MGDSMNLEQIKLILQIAEYRSMNIVAEKNFTTRQNISKQMALLEKELGWQLLLRNNKGSVLTKKGEIFCHYAKNILEQMEQMYKALEEEESGEKTAPEQLEGELTLCLPGALMHYLSKVITLFAEKYPRVRLRSNYQESFWIEQAVKNGTLPSELAFMCDLDYKQRKRNDTVFRKFLLQQDKLSVIGSVELPLMRQQTISIKQLKHEPIILYQPDNCPMTIVSNILKDYGISQRSCMVLNDLFVCEQMVSLGRGYFIILDSNEEILFGNMPTVTSLPVSDEIQVNYYLYAPGRTTISAQAEAFLQTVLIYYAEQYQIM